MNGQPEVEDDPILVGVAFVRMYYDAIHKNPEGLVNFFSSSSSFTFSEKNAAPEAPCKGKEAIREKLASLDLSSVQTEVQSIDCQSSVNGSVLVLVHGLFFKAEEVPRRFTQLFLLMKTAPKGSKGYYCLNSCFRYLDLYDVQELEAEEGEEEEPQEEEVEEAEAEEPAAEPQWAAEAQQGWSPSGYEHQIPEPSDAPQEAGWPAAPQGEEVSSPAEAEAEGAPAADEAPAAEPEPEEEEDDQAQPEPAEEEEQEPAAPEPEEVAPAPVVPEVAPAPAPVPSRSPPAKPAAAAAPVPPPKPAAPAPSRPPTSFAEALLMGNKAKINKQVAQGGPSPGLTPASTAPAQTSKPAAKPAGGRGGRGAGEGGRGAAGGPAGGRGAAGGPSAGRAGGAAAGTGGRGGGGGGAERSAENRNLPRPAVYIAKLKEGTTDEELREAFGKFGTVMSVRNIREKKIAFLEFNTEEAEHKAIEAGEKQEIVIRESVLVVQKRVLTPRPAPHEGGAEAGGPRPGRGGAGAGRGAAEGRGAPAGGRGGGRGSRPARGE